MSELTIQLTFEKPFDISDGSEPNKLQVKIWNDTLFLRQDDLAPIPVGTTVEKELPKMVDRETEEFFNDIGSFMATTGKGSLVAAFILSYFVSFAMSQLMSAVRSLQLITFMLIMELKYPPYIIEFFHMFF